MVLLSPRLLGPGPLTGTSRGGVHQGSSPPASAARRRRRIGDVDVQFLCASMSVCERVRVIVSVGSRPYGRGCLAVWPLDSRRMAWPHFTRSRLGLRSSRGRMVCNLPRALPHTCSRPLVVPHVPSPPPGLRLPLRRASWVLSLLVASGYEPRRQAAQVRRAVLDSACTAVGSCTVR